MDRLVRTARTLGRGALREKGARGLPRLWLVTDPTRTPNPVAIARRLPRGAGVLYRAFGSADAVTTGRALALVASERGLVLLVGADEQLAACIGAAGVHLPERDLPKLRPLRRRHPGWIVTVAAHSERAVRAAARAGADAVLVSVVFPSRSPSAGAALGPVRFSALVRGHRAPVIALGGLNTATAPRLLASGAYGLAAVEGLAGPRT